MVSAIIKPNTTQNPLQDCSEGMSRLPWDPHPRTTKKPSALASASASASASVSKSTAAQLLLRRGGTVAAKDESIEFFSALRRCQPDHHVSGQTERGTPDRRGKARRGCDGDNDELLSTEIGKHDYDWLLTPPTSPLWSPATSAAGHRVSEAVPNRLARARSASYAKSNSRLALTRREEDENPTSRLARSSSATHSSVNTLAIASSGRPSHVRTLSSASSSSINTASNASASSTPLGSAATSPRTPGTAKSAAATARSRRRGNVQARQVSGSATGQSKASPSLNSGRSAPTSMRPRATTGASSPRSTSTATSQQPALARRGYNAVARSRFAIQSTTWSTALAASPEPQPRDVSTRGARSSIIKPRPLPVASKQCHGNGLAAVTKTTQRWRPSPSPAVSVAQSAPSRDLLAIRSSRNGDGQKINVEKATPRRTAGLASAATSTSLTRTSCRQSANTNTKLTVNKNDGSPALRKPTVHHRSIRSVVSRSHLGLMAATSGAGKTSRDQSTSEIGKLTAGAAGWVAEPDAFPSARYDAMLLREDPKNLTWLNECDDDDDGSGGAGLVEGSLETLDVPAPAGMSGTAVRF